MNWEALSAIATAFTGLVIMFTVILGVRQARAALDQISEAHRATQLDGMMRVFEQFDDERFVRGREYIMRDLAARMDEPDFENYLRVTTPAHFPWSKTLSTLERIGVFVRLGLLEGEPFYYNWGNMIVVTWKNLKPLVELQRKVRDNPYLWKDTEWLADDASRFARKFFAENPRTRPSTGEPFTLDAFDSGSR
ncbi:MAG TPA: hypothetical protein VGR69_02795 [Candidatus Rubrimentiphilum sp.]|nr:hypothetical protein [Candidatus Rubrimentiphilum sp.]